MNKERTLEDVTRKIDIDFSGTVRMIQQFLPQFKERSQALIVNMSSVLAFIPFPASPIYSATKAAIHSFSQSCGYSLEAHG